MDGTGQDLDAGISDAELFSAANEPAGGTEVGIPADLASPPSAPAQQAIDAGQTVAEAPVQKQQEPDHRVPLRELLDEREKRQEVARQFAEMQRQHAEMQRQMEAMRNPQKPVDLFADPQGFQESLEQRLERQQHEFEQRIRVHAIDTSFSFAARQHGEEFQKAFGAFEEVAGALKGNDVMLRNRIVNAPDPGEAMMQWYHSRQILQESGGNLTAFKERLLNEQRETLLKDPAFLAEAMKAARAVGSSNPSIRPSNPTGLPSLTRTTAAAPNAGDDDGDVSDAELFRSSIGRRR